MYIFPQNRNVSPPKKPDYSDIYTSPTYQVNTLGECDEGSYVRMYIPDNPYLNNNDKIAVIYLHGFTLGAYEIYAAHLEHLVKQGYYVIFPNYQHGFCEFQEHKFETLLELIKATLKPFPISAVGWMESAINSVIAAYENLNLDKENVKTYIFGHSLGGLFALSWPHYAQAKVNSNILPKQVVVADPVPDSQSNIPDEIRDFIDSHEGFKDKVDIVETGKNLTVPVAIIHGNEDKIIPKECWEEPFKSIQTKEKKMYLSFTDNYGSPIMYANHEQATVDTSFVSDWIAKELLDGVGEENNLNWRYIWYALDQVIRFGVKADQLTFDMDKWSDGTPVQPIQVYLESLDK